mmetsp:Transcript_17543/g.35821  ORF Transcript_17543/g.35821 Transcript_17543/m.35821 type:complete len:123 (+) Transcript_17543:610-978(+)
MINIIATSIPSNMKIDTHIPFALIVTTSGVLGQIVKMSQGSGKPTRISNILLPIELDTAMSPSPILATMTLDNKSGTEVPAARNVNPITTEGMPMVFPKISAHPTMKYENKPIQMMDRTNET